jgi:hypothetical protein
MCKVFQSKVLALDLLAKALFLKYFMAKVFILNKNAPDGRGFSCSVLSIAV